MIENIINDLNWNRKINILRMAKGWSQTEAAEKCGTSQKGFCLWEQGKLYPRKNSQKEIAEVFDVLVAELFGQGKEEKNESL